MFSDLAKPLYIDLLYNLYEEDIKKIQLFKCADRSFVAALLKATKPFQALPDDILFEEADVLNEIVFVKEGSIRIATYDGQKAVLAGCVQAGNYFGDAEFYKNVSSIAQYSAIEHSELLSISHSDMSKALTENSIINTEFTRLCKKRYNSLMHVLRSKTKIDVPVVDTEKSHRRRGNNTFYKKGELLKTRAILWVDGELSDHLTSLNNLDADVNSKKKQLTVRIMDYQDQTVILKDIEPAQFEGYGVIYPSNYYKLLWDAFIGFVIVYCALIIPVEIAFNADAFEATQFVSLAIHGIFIIDMVLSFLTGYEHPKYDNAIVVNKEMIAWNYMGGWFAIDVLSSIPFDLIVTEIVGGNNSNFATLLKLARALRLIRLGRLLKISMYQEKL